LNRTFPNQITREGVMGNEWNKWSRLVTPEHKLTLPFTRFLAGPGDFTPGGFLNRQPADFRIVSTNAEVQGTRAAELALFVTFDSPICCVCDSPEHYRDQPGNDFLKIVPTVWDDTHVLEGVVADHIAVVRRHGGEYFLGAMTGKTARDLTVKLGFLGSGDWKMRLWKDAADAATNAEDLETEDRTVSASDTLTVHMVPNGGAVAHFWQ
jgi:alpha-glucosidase